MALDREVTLAEPAAGIGAVEDRQVLALEARRALECHGAAHMDVRPLDLGLAEAEMAKWINPGRYVGGPEMVSMGLAELVELKTLTSVGLNGAPRARRRAAAPVAQ